jgi:hypothetical protein
LHIIVKLIVCNNFLALAAFGTEYYLVAVFGFDNSKKLFEGFVGGYGVVRERFVFQHINLLSVLKK